MRGMADTALLPKPVDTSGDEDDLDHIACARQDRTYCGMDASEMAWTAGPISLDQVCRICVLAVEMLAPGDPCPVCQAVRCGES